MSGNHWTPEHDAYLKAHYATTDVASIAAHVGRHLQAVYARAMRLGIGRPQKGLGEGAGTLEEVLTLARRPQGVHSSELPGRTLEQFHCAVRNLIRTKRAFGRVLGVRNTRYFANEADALAFVVPPVVKARPSMVIKNRAPWPADAPMVLTPNTIYTIAPKPPERVLRTNTFLVYA